MRGLSKTWLILDPTDDSDLLMKTQHAQAQDCVQPLCSWFTCWAQMQVRRGGSPGSCPGKSGIIVNAQEQGVQLNHDQLSENLKLEKQYSDGAPILKHPRAAASEP